MLESTKNAENDKHTKNHIIIRHVVPQLNCGQALYPIFGPKYQNFQKLKKKPLNMLSFYIPLGVY